MGQLVIIKGNGVGRQFPIGDQERVIGRVATAPICLEGGNVSRRHARVWGEGDRMFLEDLGSSNGTFVNDTRVTGRVELCPNDIVRVGQYAMRVEIDWMGGAMTIQRQTMALASNIELFQENAVLKLQAVLELARHLTRSLETNVLLERLMDHLLVLFPHAERVMIFSIQDGQASIRQCKDRKGGRLAGQHFSRSVLRAVLEKGVGVLAEDVGRFQANVTLNALGIHSLLCVPFQGQSGKVFGAVQLDRFQPGRAFTAEDLHLLTTIALQVSMVLENAELHQELLVKERMVRDLAMARDIQQAFLPSAVPSFTVGRADLLGELHPAYEVAGDFYDYVAMDSDRLLLVVADVSGKGMAAALFMTMVRALLRQLAQQYDSPAEILARLNETVARDNPKCMFVTLLVGVYHIGAGRCVLARAGHPSALFRHRHGAGQLVEAPAGHLVGFDPACRAFSDVTIHLEPGDALLFYTDGVTEAACPDSGQMFGQERLIHTVESLSPMAPLRDWSTQIRSEITAFSKGTGPQDDLTLLFLRRA